MDVNKEYLEEQHLIELEKKLKKKLAKKYKKTLIGLLIIFIALAAIIIGLFAYANYLHTKLAEEQSKPSIINPISPEINLDVIHTEMKNIGELATQEFLYTDAAKFSDPKEVGNIKLPFAFTTKTFIAKWDGSIKAGINLAEVDITENKLTKQIVVKMPKAKILSHEIDDESFEALDEKDGLFNPIEISDYKTFESTCKTEMEERAIGNGLLEKATTNAQGIIRNLINTDPVAKQGYTIVFEIKE